MSGVYLAPSGYAWLLNSLRPTPHDMSWTGVWRLRAKEKVPGMVDITGGSLYQSVEVPQEHGHFFRLSSLHDCRGVSAALSKGLLRCKRGLAIGSMLEK